MMHMSNNEIREIDRRLAQIANAISKLEGERDGLMFTRRLLTRKQPANDEGQTTHGIGDGMQLPPRRPVGEMALEVVNGHPSGLRFRSICECVNKIAGKAVNTKTVSSALCALKEKDQLVFDRGFYKPTQMRHAA
jgi:hypothetical protein